MEGVEVSDSGTFPMEIVISLGTQAEDLRAVETFEVPTLIMWEIISDITQCLPWAQALQPEKLLET